MNEKNNPIRIAEAQIYHVESLYKIEKECFSIPWSANLIEEEITHPESIFLCAYYMGNLAGFGTLRNICGEGHITNIAVRPTYRNLGIASAIVQQIVIRAKKKGIFDLTLEVRVSNQAAITLYTKFGFHTLGVRKKYYTDNNEDALVMWNYLNGESPK